MLKNQTGNIIIIICFLQLLISCGGGGSNSTELSSEATLSSISLSTSGSSIPIDFNQSFIATGTYSDTSTKNISTEVTWSSSNINIAMIDSSGFVTGISTGTTIISATIEEITKTFTLTVSSATLTSISITPSNSSVAVGKAKLFNATGIFSDGTSINISQLVNWSSNSNEIASVQSNGIVIGNSIGNTIITATYKTISESTLLEVTASSLSSITVSPSTSSIASGNLQIYEASGNYSDGSTMDLSSSVTWASSKINIATIQSSGIATGISVGSSIISATLDGISGTATLTVTAATLNSISVTPTTTSIFIGITKSFFATGTYSNTSTSNISNSVTWSSNNISIATVSSQGVVTGISAGEATITATLEGKSNSATLTVNSPATFQDVSNVINTNCTICHGSPTNNNAPMSLTTYTEISLFADSISNRINKSEGSNQLMPKDGPKLSESDIAIIDSWIADGKLNN